MSQKILNLVFVVVAALWCCLNGMNEKGFFKQEEMNKAIETEKAISSLTTCLKEKRNVISDFNWFVNGKKFQDGQLAEHFLRLVWSKEDFELFLKKQDELQNFENKAVIVFCYGDIFKVHITQKNNAFSSYTFSRKEDELGFANKKGTLLATAGAGDLTVWDIQEGKIKYQFSANELEKVACFSQVEDIAFGPDDKTLIVLAHAKNFKNFNLDIIHQLGLIYIFDLEKHVVRDCCFCGLHPQSLVCHAPDLITVRSKDNVFFITRFDPKSGKMGVDPLLLHDFKKEQIAFIGYEKKENNDTECNKETFTIITKNKNDTYNFYPMNI